MLRMWHRRWRRAAQGNSDIGKAGCGVSDEADRHEEAGRHEESIGEGAVTYAYGEGEMVDSCWGRMTWRDWCNRELERCRQKGDTLMRLAEGHGYIWLTR
jgi:hypothetical protein